MENQRNIKELIDELTERESGAPVVSLYFETSPQPDRLQSNTIRLKNVLADASGQLENLGMSKPDIEQIRDLALDAASAWRDGSGLDRGIGIFIDGENKQLRALPLPFAVDEIAVAAPKFYLKPLFGALEHRHAFWLLALSQGQVSLFHGDGFGLREVDAGDDVPDSLKEVTGYQPDGKHLHFHAVHRDSSEAQWHGRGAGKDDMDSEIEQFLAHVDEGLETLWHNTDEPVILAGVEDLVATYRGLTKCRTLLDGQVEGNVEELNEEELHRRAWPLLARRLERERREALERIENADPELPVARKLPDVVRAAKQGRVDTAFLACDSRQWGSIDEKDFSVSTHDEFEAGDLDLIDRAAVETHRNGGTVYLFEKADLPGKSVAMAQLRY